MATDPSTVPAFLDALKAGLEARAGLSAVQVSTALLDGESRSESIQMARVDQDEDWGPIGARTKDENYEVAMVIWKVQPGAGEATAKTARDRVYAILAEVAAWLRENPRPLAGVMVAAMSNADLDQGVNPDGRWAQLTFAVRVEARLNFVEE